MAIQTLFSGSRNTRYLKFFTVIALLFYLPVVLLLIGIVPYEYRYYLLFLITILIASLTVYSHFTWKELGFRRDTLQGSLTWNGILSFLFLALLLIAYFLGSLRSPNIPGTDTTSKIAFIIFYIFISGPCQEFLYRSFMFALMERAGIAEMLPKLVISAITYCFLHIFYRDLITLMVTIIMGFIWGYVYYKKPNFWGVMISHSILGAVAIAVGLI
jgi:hypothetical protein